MPESSVQSARTDSVLIARLANAVRWAGCEDRAAATAAARQAFADRWDKLVDPDGTLDPVERAKRAAHAKKAFYLKLALKSAQVRRANAKGRKLAKTADKAAVAIAAEVGSATS